jgi:hypothetical protein
MNNTYKILMALIAIGTSVSIYAGGGQKVRAAVYNHRHPQPETPKEKAEQFIDNHDGNTAPQE